MARRSQTGAAALAATLALALAAGFGGCGDDPVPPQWFYLTVQNSDLPSDDVYGVYAAGEDAWYATGAGLAYNRGGEWRVWTHEDGLPSDIVFGVVGLPNGDIWVATAEGAARLRDDVLTAYTTADGLPSNNVMAVCYDGARIWCATEGGLARWDEDHFTPFTSAQGLPGDDCRDVFAAGTGQVWVATLGGIGYYNRGEITAYGIGSGLPSYNCYAVAARGADTWIGTDKGIALLRGGEIVRTYNAANSNLGSDIINDLAFDTKGALWAGTVGGASWFTGGDFRNFGEDQGLLSPYVLAAFGGERGYIWFGTLGGGMNRYSQ